MSYYLGLDLHANNTYVGMIDERDRCIFSQKVANEVGLIKNILFPYKADIAGIVVESTFNWYWLVDELIEEGYKVHLANPCAIQQYKGLKYTNDKHDAFWLAKMLRLGILPEGYIHSRPERQLRDLLRKRLMLVYQRTQHILSFKSLMNRNLCVHLKGHVIKTLADSQVDDLIFERNLNLSAKANISTMNYLAHQIKEIEKDILGQVKYIPEYEKLLTVMGIGKILGLTIVLETGDINRFKSVGHYASYCRCVPSKRISNDKKKGENNRKNGNKYLSWAFVEAAHFAKRDYPLARFFYNKKSRKSNHFLALKALAHKICRASYYIMKDKVDFDPLKLFNSPIKLDKGCSSEPGWGLGKKPKAPIGQAAAATDN